MSSGTIALSPTAVARFHVSDLPPPIQKSSITYLPVPPGCSSVMWRNLAKQAISRTPRTSFSSPLFTRPYCFLGYSHDSNLRGKFKFRPIELSYCKKKRLFDTGIQGNSDFMLKDDALAMPGWTTLGNSGNFHWLSPKGYVSLVDVETVSSSDTKNEVGLVEEFSALLEEMLRCEEEKKKKIMKEKEGQSDPVPLRRRRRVAGMGPKKYWAMRRRQVQVETEVWEKATKEYKELLVDMCEHKLAPNLPYVKTLFLGWFEPFRDKIAEVQESIWQGKCRNSFAPYFDQLPADMMAVITMHKLVALLLTGDEHGCARVVQAACVIGDAIEQEIRIQKFLEKTKKKSDQGNKDEEGSSGALQEQQRLRKKVTDLLKKKKLQAVRHIVKDQDDLKPWGTDAKAKVGSYLIELLLQTAYIQVPGDLAAEGAPDVRPAFVHTFKTIPHANKNSTRRHGVIQCDPQVIKGLEKTARHMVIPYMPMLIPPVKWTGYDQGAHLILPSSVMRTHGSKQQREAVKRTPISQLQPVYQALDILGRTKWRVNKRVLDTVDAIWSSGGRLGDLVNREDVPLPEKPVTEDEAEVKKWKWKVRSIKKENRERHSQRCDIELKLAVARKMKDEEGFFYPHNLDFRGRAYPMHPHLNHLGSDLCRGILEFADGRPLGDSGLRWLKIHLANLFANGVDKLSLEGRIAFTESHLDEIFDSADKPLQGMQWWLKAEDPFQCLAVCVDLAEALRSPSPLLHISHIPVHQDGSCNGLQHYAALGRDELGAASVNLVAGDIPADVYSGIAARVLNIMKQDAEEDPDVYAEALYARQLIHQVDRKLVKQTVMTSVYGVTYIGARDQIKRRLKEREIFSDSGDLFYASCYAAKVTLTALGEMFQAARCIMSWLGDCAKIIASENQSVKWTTPLGLPVIQPYRQRGRHLVRTSLQVLTLQRETEKVMIKRQRTAFPPNFVHSLDGSHMMMTAIACRKAGLNFAGVHDSYWTHACDVDKMNRILREKFVELYEQPILENLLESFEKSFPTVSFPPLPERGNFNIREVLKSPYFFN